MIIRRGTPRSKTRSTETHGTMETQSYGDTGGLTQYGAYLQTLAPGATSSNRHWHEREDEFLYVVTGEVTVVEDDGRHVLGPGDAACWPAGAPNAHCVVNASQAPCSYLIVGTRLTHDVCHYPDSGRTLHTEGETWRIVDADGRELRAGRVEPDW